MGVPALQGVRVLELGNALAGPVAARILADFGAEVIKVEPPQGDQLRTWGLRAPDGWSWWFKATNRGKACVCYDLHDPEQAAIVQRIALQSDILVQNFRPGKLEEWGLGYEQLRALNPRLIYVAISGYGADGPYAQRAGYGNIGEAVGGIRYVTGEPDGPPMRIGISIGDELAAMYAALGALAALRARETTGEGDFVDVALNESVFSLMEAALPEYVHHGVVRHRHGNRYLRSAPNNMYKARDGEWIVIAGNGDSIFKRLCAVIGRPDLWQDPRYTGNAGRAENAAELDALIGAWAADHDSAEIEALCAAAGVPVGPVNSIADICEDPQLKAREMIVRVPDEHGVEVAMAAVVPRLRNHAAPLRRAAGAIGRDTAGVAQQLQLFEEAHR